MARQQIQNTKYKNIAVKKITRAQGSRHPVQTGKYQSQQSIQAGKEPA
jgi:hypothetical protein